MNLIKQLLVLKFSCIAMVGFTQNKVGYHYDNNGNRDQRFFIGLRPSSNNSGDPADTTLASSGQNTFNTIPAQTIAMENGVTVYPNPTRDVVMVSITKAGVKESKQATLYLIDSNGRIIDSKKYAGAELSFDLSKRPPGNYYLNIVFEDGSKLSYNVVKID